MFDNPVVYFDDISGNLPFRYVVLRIKTFHGGYDWNRLAADQKYVAIYNLMVNVDKELLPMFNLVLRRR